MISLVSQINRPNVFPWPTPEIPDETELFKEGLTLEVWTDYKKVGKLASKDTQRDILARIYFGGIQNSLR